MCHVVGIRVVCQMNSPFPFGNGDLCMDLVDDLERLQGG